MWMLTVLIPMEALCVNADLDILGVDSIVQVSNFIAYYDINFVLLYTCHHAPIYDIGVAVFSYTTTYCSES